MQIDALISLGLLVALVCLVYGPWQSLCTAMARQFMFEIRDHIFDLARAGKLDFRSAEYRTIRASLETSIQFAHELTWIRFIWFAQAMRRQGVFDRKSDLMLAIDQIDDATVREDVRSRVNAAYQVLVALAIAKSPLLIAASVVVGCVAVIQRALKNRVRQVSQLGEAIQVEAEVISAARRS